MSDMFTVFNIFTENQSVFLEVVITSLSTMLAIVFSISLVAIQHASEKYIPRVFDYYIKNKWIVIMFFVFLVGIIFSLSVLGSPIECPFREEISFVFLLVGLVAVLYNFIKVSEFINPSKLLKVLSNDILKRDDEEIQRNIILDIKVICLKSEENVAKECVQTLEYTGKKIQSEINKDCVASQLREIGKKYAKEPTKQYLSIYCICSLLNLAKENIEIIKSKADSLYLISNPIVWCKEIFKEIIFNKHLNEIDNNQIDMVFNSIYLLIKTAFIDEPSKLEVKRRNIKDMLDLAKFIYLRSKDIPRLKENYKYVVKSYKERLDMLYEEILKKKIPCEIKTQIRDMKEKAEKMYNKYWGIK